MLQRYELLFEAGLVAEAGRNSRAASDDAVPGFQMLADHRRILATGIARLRTKIKYRPVVFEVMPQVFTLPQLQRAVEALAGRLFTNRISGVSSSSRNSSRNPSQHGRNTRY